MYVTNKLKMHPTGVQKKKNDISQFLKPVLCFYLNQILERLQWWTGLVISLDVQGNWGAKIPGLLQICICPIWIGQWQECPVLGQQGWRCQGFACTADWWIKLPEWRHQNVWLRGQWGSEISQRRDLLRPVGISETHFQCSFCLPPGNGLYLLFIHFMSIY